MLLPQIRASGAKQACSQAASTSLKLDPAQGALICQTCFEVASVCALARPATSLPSARPLSARSFAFAALTAISSKALIKGLPSRDLSVQQVLDCVNNASNPSYQSSGCNGGYPGVALPGQAAQTPVCDCN